MARILTQDQHLDTWFERLSVVSSYTESEFETKILQHSSELFKEYYVIPFKKELSHIHNSSDKTIPDLVMIKRDYSEWWFVEVEKAEHTLIHVSGQVEIMTHANFDPLEIATYIKSKEGFVMDPPNFLFDLTVIQKLVKEQKPKVLVVVDESRPVWETELNTKRVKLCVIQIYKNTQNQEIYRIKGQYPYIFMDAGFCKAAKAPYPANTLEVVNPDILSVVNNQDELEIVFKGSITKWNLMRTTKKVYLKSIGKRFPLASSQDYIIRKDSNDRYHFE